MILRAPAAEVGHSFGVGRDDTCITLADWLEEGLCELLGRLNSASAILFTWILLEVAPELSDAWRV